MVVTLFPFFFSFLPDMLLFIFFYREFLVRNLLFFLIGGNCSITLCFLSDSAPPRPSWFPRDAHHGPAVRSFESLTWLDIGQARSRSTCSLCWGSWRRSWAPPAPPGCPLEAAACPQRPPLGGEDIRHARLSALGLVPGGLPPHSDLLPESSGPRPHQEDSLQPRGKGTCSKENRPL